MISKVAHVRLSEEEFAFIDKLRNPNLPIRNCWTL